MSTTEQVCPPLPPFRLATAKEKVQKAEDAWNSCDPDPVALAYAKDSDWFNRAVFSLGMAVDPRVFERKLTKELIHEESGDGTMSAIDFS